MRPRAPAFFYTRLHTASIDVKGGMQAMWWHVVSTVHVCVVCMSTAAPELVFDKVRQHVMCGVSPMHVSKSPHCDVQCALICHYLGPFMSGMSSNAMPGYV